MNMAAAPLGEPHRDRGVKIAHVPSGANWRVIVTAHKVARCHVHFIDGRTRPCSLPQHPCPACNTGASKRFEAYLGVYNLSRQVPQVLALPEGAWLRFEEAAGALLLSSVRGSLWQFSRGGTTRRGPITVESLGQEPDPAGIPRGIMVPAVLYRAWQLPLPDDWSGILPE